MKKRERLKIYTIKDPIYNQSFLLCIGKKEDFDNRIERLYGVERDTRKLDGARFTLFNEQQDKSVQYVWVKSFDWSIQDQALLAHELLHQAMRALNDCGVQIKNGIEETNEEFVYYFEYLFKQVWQKLKPLHKKPSKQK